MKIFKKQLNNSISCFNDCPMIKILIFFITVQRMESCQSATENGTYQVQINGRLVQVYCEVNAEEKWLV